MKFPKRAKSLQYSRRRAVCDSTLTIRPFFLRDEIEEIEDDQRRVKLLVDDSIYFRHESSIIVSCRD